MKVIETNEFRIKEFNGEFTIQKRIVERYGMWLWKRSEIRWSGITIYGEPLYYLPAYGRHPAITNKKDKCPSFKTLKEAKEFLRGIEKGETFHYL